MLTFGTIHEEFLSDQTPQIDLEGARYSAKTWTCCAKLLRSAKKFEGIRWLACRYSNEETKTKIKTVMQYEVAPRMGIELRWNEDERAFTVPTVTKDSKIFCHGLKAQNRNEELAKVRGLDMGGIWNDQTEELPQAIAEELPFGTRQEGYPHQLILSPNPPGEDHYLADMFPDECLHTVPVEERLFKHRVYYRLSLYDNPHCPPDKLAELESNFPATHAKYKSLILGLRGPNVTGTPVYNGLFARPAHVSSVTWMDGSLLLEAIHSGQHHPAWIAAQRSPLGGLEILGGVIGKRMFLEDFLPVVDKYRSEWFEGDAPMRVWTATDPPPSLDQDEEGTRYSLVNVLRDHGLRPRWRVNGNAPDVREAVIQHLGSQMRRHGGFTVNRDPSRWLMVSPVVTKHTKLFVDALEGSYIWDENMVSVGNKKVRQPRADQWLEGWMRCLENIALNFSAGQGRPADERREPQAWPMPMSEHSWLY